MPKSKNARVYISESGVFYDFLWGDTGDDGSVYFGLIGTGTQKVEQITVGTDFNQSIEQMTFHPYSGPQKISFHSSGEYTLANIVEEDNESNRLVAHGTPLAEIEHPTRMMDVIMPVKLLKPIQKALPDIFIQLTAEFKNCTHISCTVYCMKEMDFHSFGEECDSIIRGASWESKNGFLSGDKVWAFFLHDAVHESMKKQYCLISINGAGTDAIV